MKTNLSMFLFWLMIHISACDSSNQESKPTSRNNLFDSTAEQALLQSLKSDFVSLGRSMPKFQDQIDYFLVEYPHVQKDFNEIRFIDTNLIIDFLPQIHEGVADDSAITRAIIAFNKSMYTLLVTSDYDAFGDESSDREIICFDSIPIDGMKQYKMTGLFDRYPPIDSLKRQLEISLPQNALYRYVKEKGKIPVIGTQCMPIAYIQLALNYRATMNNQYIDVYKSFKPDMNKVRTTISIGRLSAYLQRHHKKIKHFI